MVGVAERQAADGGVAAGAAMEPDQEVGLVLEREVDFDAAVGPAGAARRRPLAGAAAPDPAPLVGGELALDLADALAADMLDQVEPMDAVVEQNEGRAAQAGGEVPDIFVAVED